MKHKTVFSTFRTGMVYRRPPVLHLYTAVLPACRLSASAACYTSTLPLTCTCICLALQGFLAEGLQRTSAGLGSVIIDSQPLTVAVLAALLFGEQLGPVAILGLLAGVAGLLLLEVPQDTLMALLPGT